MNDTNTPTAMSKQGELRSDQTKPNKTVSLKGAGSRHVVSAKTNQPSINNDKVVNTASVEDKRDELQTRDSHFINDDKMYRVRPVTIHHLKKKATHIWQYTEPGCRTVEEGNMALKEISRIVDEIVELEQTIMEVE